MAPESITDYLFTAAGAIIDWCIHEAGYDLNSYEKVHEPSCYGF